MVDLCTHITPPAQRTGAGAAAPLASHHPVSERQLPVRNRLPRREAGPGHAAPAATPAAPATVSDFFDQLAELEAADPGADTMRQATRPIPMTHQNHSARSLTPSGPTREGHLLRPGILSCTRSLVSGAATSEDLLIFALASRNEVTASAKLSGSCQKSRWPNAPVSGTGHLLPPAWRTAVGAGLASAPATPASRARMVAVATRCRIAPSRSPPRRLNGGRYAPASARRVTRPPAGVRLMSPSIRGNMLPAAPVASPVDCHPHAVAAVNRVKEQ